MRSICKLDQAIGSADRPFYSLSCFLGLPTAGLLENVAESPKAEYARKRACQSKKMKNNTEKFISWIAAHKSRSPDYVKILKIIRSSTTVV